LIKKTKLVTQDKEVETKKKSKKRKFSRCGHLKS
jgi:hypothetical protein